MAADNTMWYSINKTELYVVLAALGVRKWYGFGVSDEDMPCSCENVNRLLADLYKNEVISFDDARLVLEEGWSGIIDVLRSSEKCVYAVSSRRRGGTVLSYSSGDSVVMTECSPSDSSTIRMSLTTRSSWPRLILGEIMDFDRISKGQVKVADEEVRTLCGDAVSAADTASLPDVIAVFDMIDIQSGKIEERLAIREKGLLQYMVAEKAEEERVSVMEGGLSETSRFLDRWTC